VIFYVKFCGVNFALFDCLDTEFGGSKFLRNVGVYIYIYTHECVCVCVCLCVCVCMTIRADLHPRGLDLH
jgi:hypothetical protein